MLICYKPYNTEHLSFWKYKENMQKIQVKEVEGKLYAICVKHGMGQIKCLAEINGVWKVKRLIFQEKKNTREHDTIWTLYISTDPIKLSFVGEINDQSFWMT